MPDTALSTGDPVVRKLLMGLACSHGGNKEQIAMDCTMWYSVDRPKESQGRRVQQLREIVISQTRSGKVSTE